MRQWGSGSGRQEVTVLVALFLQRALHSSSGVSVAHTIANRRKSEKAGLLHFYPKSYLPAYSKLLLIGFKKTTEEYCRLPFPSGDQPTLVSGDDSDG